MEAPDIKGGWALYLSPGGCCLCVLGLVTPLRSATRPSLRVLMESTCKFAKKNPLRWRLLPLAQNTQGHHSILLNLKPLQATVGCCCLGLRQPEFQPVWAEFLQMTQLEHQEAGVCDNAEMHMHIIW